MTATEMTARSLNLALWLIEQMTGDLTPEQWLHRPCKDANCAAWIVGHLVLSTRGMMGRLGGESKVELPEGFDTRYSQKENAPQASEFGDTAVLLPLLKRVTEELIVHLEGLSQEFLVQANPKPHPLFKTVADFAALAPIHLAMHTGQISTIRRTLGKPPVF